MTGINLFNMPSSGTTGFSAPSLNTAPAVGSVNNQQTSTFGALGTSNNVSFGTLSNTAGLGSVKPQFGSPGSTLFGGTNQASTQSGFTFGTNVATGSTSQSDNTSLIKPAFGSSTFGSTPSLQTSISFGTPGVGSTPQTGLSLGTTHTPQTGLSFGTPTQTSQSGISFGTPTTSTSTTSGLSFGSTPQTGISFGLPTATATTVPQTGLTFGMPVTSSMATTTQSSLLSAPTTNTASTGVGFSFGTSSTSQPTLSFGTVTATTTVALGTTTSSTPLFGGLSTTTPTTALNSGLLTSTASTGGIFSWQKTSTDTTPTSTASVGLGGVIPSTITTTQSCPSTVLSVKEQPLPNEIQETVTAFKEYVKSQKSLSSEVARSSAEPLGKLSRQIEALNNLIINLGNMLSQQKFTAERIKSETIKSLNDYELAQKIKDSPVASEERMLTIRKYFTEKISSCEENTKILQDKIEYIHQHVITLPQENSLSAEALKLIVRKLHDSFVVISARAYQLHNDMQLLKVQYLTLRNQYVKDNSSISFNLSKELQLRTSSKCRADLSLEGPNPFSKCGSGSLNPLLLSSQNRNFSGQPTSSPGGSLLNSSKPFGFSDMTTTSLLDQSKLNTSQQFNLQKPPLGNKRGKR